MSRIYYEVQEGSKYTGDEIEGHLKFIEEIAGLSFSYQFLDWLVDMGMVKTFGDGQSPERAIYISRNNLEELAQECDRKGQSAYFTDGGVIYLVDPEKKVISLVYVDKGMNTKVALSFITRIAEKLEYTNTILEDL